MAIFTVPRYQPRWCRWRHLRYNFQHTHRDSQVADSRPNAFARTMPPSTPLAGSSLAVPRANSTSLSHLFGVQRWVLAAYSLVKRRHCCTQHTLPSQEEDFCALWRSFLLKGSLSGPGWSVLLVTFTGVMDFFRNMTGKS